MYRNAETANNVKTKVNSFIACYKRGFRKSNFITGNTIIKLDSTRSEFRFAFLTSRVMKNLWFQWILLLVFSAFVHVSLRSNE